MVNRDAQYAHQGIIGLRKGGELKKLAIAIIPLLVLALVFGAIGCKKAATPSPSPSPTLTLTPTPIPTSSPSPTPTLTPTPTPTPTTGALFLSVTQPQDQSVVNTASITISGRTIHGAVVSVSLNDSIYIPSVDNNGYFTISVPLDEGPNLIEVIASDYYGNQKSVNISIIYTT